MGLLSEEKLSLIILLTPNNKHIVVSSETWE